MNDPAEVAQTLAFSALFISFATIVFVNPLISLIPGVAAVSYWNMLRDKDSIEFYRYTHWILTTPMMLLAVLTASRVSLPGIVGLLLADITMIWAGYRGVKSPDRDERRKWFILGCLAFAPILWVFANLKMNSVIMLTIATWLMYPIIWLSSEENILTRRTTTVLYACMDVIAKVGLVWLLGG